MTNGGNFLSAQSRSIQKPLLCVDFSAFGPRRSLGIRIAIGSNLKRNPLDTQAEWNANNKQKTKDHKPNENNLTKNGDVRYAAALPET